MNNNNYYKRETVKHLQNPLHGCSIEKRSPCSQGPSLFSTEEFHVFPSNLETIKTDQILERRIRYVCTYQTPVCSDQLWQKIKEELQTESNSSFKEKLRRKRYLGLGLLLLGITSFILMYF